MAKNVSEGEIQPLDLCPSWYLHTSASLAMGMPERSTDFR